MNQFKLYPGAPAPQQTDGYKVGHKDQYPFNTVKIYINLTPRKSRVTGIDEVVVFGLTYFIKRFLFEYYDETFFSKNKGSVIAAYKRRLDNYLGKNNLTYTHLEALHDLQYLPITIKALPEGSLCKTGIPVLTITNELPEFFWLPNFLETILSCMTWPMFTAATTAFNYRLIFDKFALETTGSTAFSSTFQAHDFSFRGLVGMEAPTMIGAAHLTCFAGTDTIPSIDMLEHYYNCNSDNELVGASISATEHSVMCMGMKEAEILTFKRLICEVYPDGFVGIVSDTWDLFGVVRPKTGLAAQLHEEIMARDGRVVFRPDSGDPAKIITGYKIRRAFGDDGEVAQCPSSGRWYRLEDYKMDLETTPVQIVLKQGGRWLDEAEVKGVVECLWDEFGGITNEKGFKELDTHVGVIYGDSITLDRARDICQRLKDKGFASTNWVAGVGSYSYQYVTRDTFGFAVKATYGELFHPFTDLREEEGVVYGTIDGVEQVIDVPWEVVQESPEIGVIESREIFKDPITDDGTKKSAKGWMVVLKDEKGDFYMKDQVTEAEEATGELEIVYENGQLLVDPTLAEIRERVNQNVLRRLKIA